tara:strand:- start:1572 stop:1685 length:114 start_codon:yes stop_codon:yes gene_type:complete
MTPEPNQALILIISLTGIGVVWFVLFGQRKHNELMKE